MALIETEKHTKIKPKSKPKPTVNVRTAHKVCI